MTASSSASRRNAILVLKPNDPISQLPRIAVAQYTKVWPNHIHLCVTVLHATHHTTRGRGTQYSMIGKMHPPQKFNTGGSRLQGNLVGMKRKIQSLCKECMDTGVGSGKP